MDSEQTGPKRRLGSPWAVVAVVAVLAAGGGGAYWASSYASGHGTGRAAGAPGGDATPAPLDMTGATAWSGGKLTAGDGVELPDGPSTAAVRRPQSVPRAAVEKLAKALGVPGTVKADGDFWKAGNTEDGSGPLLQVDRRAPGTWSYSLYGSRDRSERGGAVSAKEALDDAAAVLKAAGLDGDRSRTDASKTFGALRAVTADPVVGGLPTHGWSTTVRVGPDGKVVGGYGRLSPLSATAGYPVVTAEQALESLNGAAGGAGASAAGQCPTIVPKESRTPGDQTLPQVMPCVPGGKQPATVRSAEFGLATRFVDGRAALVPSWLFTVERGGEEATMVLPVTAVAPDYVRTPSQGASGSVSPAPSTSGSVAPGIHEMEIHSYSASGTTLTVRFWGGICSTYSASADESGDKVTVRVTGTPKKPGQVCAMLAKQFTETVRLEAPLGDRTVVDASDGQSVKKG